MSEQEVPSWTLVLKLPWKLEELTLYLKRLHTRMNLVLGFLGFILGFPIHTWVPKTCPN